MSPPGCHSWTLNTVCPNLNLSFFSLKHVCPFIQANITTQLSKSDPGRYPYYFPAPAPRAPNSAHFTSHIFSLPLPIPNTVFLCLHLGFSPATPSSTTADQMISVVPDSALRAWMASWACQYFLHSFI